nr:glyoxysomal fatty acid beta-oxidation multifunctional protein MFP-A-like [Ipomoea batatas]
MKVVVVTGAKGKFSGCFDIAAFGGLQGEKAASLIIHLHLGGQLQENHQ